ncbi:MAG: hypothetical protein LAO20_19235 [Acidobacteriia bacterium]|nr:hypothetical protein [Terriglobia bacterium]
MSVLALAVITLMSAASYAQIQNLSTQIGTQGINQPRGMVRVTVPNPAGGTVSDYWVTDSVAGFCRLSAAGILEIATCDVNGTFEMKDYQAETNGINGSNGYIFVGSIDGVRRFDFVFSGGRTAINTTTVLAGAGSIFTNGVAISGRNLPDTVSMGPDGKLYMGFVSNTDIWRVLNPLSPTFTVAGNKIERVGVDEGTGGRVTALAWIGHDLWMSDVGFINRIQNADQCFYTFPKCSAIIQFRNLFVTAGMESDQFISSIPNGRWLYMANGSRVIRYDTTTPGFMEVWNQAGTLAAGGVQHYSLITGLNFLQTLNPTLLNATPTDPGPTNIEEMTVTMDPFVNALFPPAPLIAPRNGAGKTWLLPASATLQAEFQCDGNATTLTVDVMPGCAIGSIGNTGVEASPNPIAVKRGILLASGITHPRGVLWLASNWWVSDEALGFCRIDVNPITGNGTLSNCFQPDATFIPGQTAAGAPDANGVQVVYVPDASGITPSIYRFVFTPGPGGGTLVLNGILDGTGSRKGTWLQTVALPTGPFNDGALYVGYADSGFMEKITNPATAPSAAGQIARLFNGTGVISMAFNGNDLYLSELGPPPIAGQFIKKGQVTNLLKASPSMAQGGASPVKRAIARLQTPQIIVENSGGFAVGPTTYRPSCLPPPGVKLSPSVPADPATTPAFYIGTLGLPADGVLSPGVSNGLAEDPEVDQYDFVCNVQNVYVTDAALDPLLSSNLPLGAVTAIGFTSLTDPTAVMAIGDDPSVIVPTQTRQRGIIRKNGPPGTGSVGQGHVYLVQ